MFLQSTFEGFHDNKKYGGPLDQRKRIKKNSDVEFPTKEVGTILEKLTFQDWGNNRTILDVR